MKKLLTLIIGILIILGISYHQKPYIKTKINSISEIDPLILVNSNNSFPENVNLNLVTFQRKRQLI